MQLHYQDQSSPSGEYSVMAYFRHIKLGSAFCVCVFTSLVKVQGITGQTHQPGGHMSLQGNLLSGGATTLLSSQTFSQGRAEVLWATAVALPSSEILQIPENQPQVGEMCSVNSI